MDKFGIFNLINSFFNFYEKNKSGADEKNVEETPSLFSNVSAPAPQTEKKKKPAPPLQSTMLYTMNSHDQFIRRVKEKHGTQNKKT